MTTSTTAISPEDASLLAAWLDSDDPITKIASDHGLSIVEIALWARRADIAEVIATIQAQYEARARLQATKGASDALLTLSVIAAASNPTQSQEIARRAAEGILRRCPHLKPRPGAFPTPGGSEPTNAPPPPTQPTSPTTPNTSTPPIASTTTTPTPCAPVSAQVRCRALHACGVDSPSTEWRGTCGIASRFVTNSSSQQRPPPQPAERRQSARRRAGSAACPSSQSGR